MNFTLCLTHDCNLNCSYCYAGAKRKQAMTWETARAGIAFALGQSKEKAQLGFFGGEPLLEWDLLQRSTEEAEAQADAAGIKLVKTVTTNATLCTDERLDWLKEHGFFVALSIDGNRAMHEITRPLAGGGSSFDACMEGLDRTLTRWPDAEVILVPDPSNVQHLAESVGFLAEEKNVLRVAVNPNFYLPWSDEALAVWDGAFESIGDLVLDRFRAMKPVAVNFIDSKIITRLKDGYACGDRCDFGEREVAIAPSGRLYPCERLVGEDTNDELCIGTVQEGFDEDKRVAILARRGNVNPECVTCALKSRCMNWCGCINYALTGRIDQTDGILCFHEQLAIRVADRVGGTLYNEGNPVFLSRFYYEDFKDMLPESAGNSDLSPSGN